MVIAQLKTTLSMEDAIKLVDKAINHGHGDRGMRKTKRLAEKLGNQLIYRNHFKACTINELSVLNFAARSGHVFLARLLLNELDVDPNTTQYDESDRTTLHYAAESGKLELVTELIEAHHSDPTAVDAFGSTPLHLAVFCEHSDIATYIVNSGANTEAENHFGRAMHLAAFIGNASSVTAIAEMNPPEVDVFFGLFTPLMCALYGKEPECEEILVQLSAVEGKALFYKVVCSKDNETEALGSINSLLQRMADPNICEEELYEDLAIIYAAKKGWRQVVAVLLEGTNHIADVDWTVTGLIDHVNSDEFKIMETGRLTSRVANLRSRILNELADRNALNALGICMSLKPYMNPVDWGYLYSLCQFLTYMWFQGFPVPCNHEEILPWIHILSGDREKRAWAVIGLEGCLALSPNNPVYIALRADLRRRN